MRRIVVASTVIALVTTLQTPVSAYARPGRTTRVSPVLDANGQPASGGRAALSGDGRVVAFATAAPLLADDTNARADVYVRELDSGLLQRVSVGGDGRQGNAHSLYPDLSFDGRFVAFASSATTFIANDANGPTMDVYVRDRAQGTTTLVSLGASGVQGDGSSTTPSISDDGQLVAFLSDAGNLVAGDTNGVRDAFVRDLARSMTERASVDSDGSQGATAAGHLSLSGNGRFAVFVHRASFGFDTSPFDDVFVHDRVTRTTEVVSVPTDGSAGQGQAFYPSISDDGRFVAFGTFATNYVPDDRNGAADAFVRDRQTGVTERVSVTSAGVEANHVFGVPIISGNGRYVTGNVLATNFGYDDSNGNTDVYVYDRASRTVELVSVSANGSSTGNAISYYPALSDDGRRVAFVSEASDLMDDGVDGTHAYLRELGPPIGAGALRAVPWPERISVEGWARFSGVSLLSVADPPRDAGSVAATAGGELTGVAVIARPEEDDVLFQLDLAPRQHQWPPLLGTSLHKPGAMTYAIEFHASGVHHEVRASMTLRGPTFGVYRCAPDCARISDASGGIGTVRDAVLVSVPLDALPDAMELGLRRAYVAVEDESTGQLRSLDESALSPVVVPAPSVEVALAPTGTAVDKLPFVSADIDRGRFSAALPPHDGADELVARACLADDCRVSRQRLP